MTDWKTIAQARGLGIPDDEMNRLTAPLETLDQIIRPLTRDLPASLEPDTSFDLDQEPA